MWPACGSVSVSWVPWQSGEPSVSVGLPAASGETFTNTHTHTHTHTHRHTEWHRVSHTDALFLANMFRHDS